MSVGISGVSPAAHTPSSSRSSVRLTDGLSITLVPQLVSGNSRWRYAPTSVACEVGTRKLAR